MRSHIHWEGTCHDNVNAILASGPLGRELVSAFELIEGELASDPELKGRSVAEGLRSIDAGCLRAYYYVEPQDQLVKVVGLRLLNTWFFSEIRFCGDYDGRLARY